jgi:Lar family restriction alleviation protein
MSDNNSSRPDCGSRAVQDSKEYGLLPCPFCGAPGQVLGTANALDEDGDYYIECSDCGVPATSVYSTPEAAVPEWNQRSHPADNAAAGRVETESERLATYLEDEADFAEKRGGHYILPPTVVAARKMAKALRSGGYAKAAEQRETIGSAVGEGWPIRPSKAWPTAEHGTANRTSDDLSAPSTNELLAVFSTVSKIIMGLEDHPTHDPLKRLKRAQDIIYPLVRKTAAFEQGGEQP